MDDKAGLLNQLKIDRTGRPVRPSGPPAWPLVAGGVLFAGLCIVIANILVDLDYAVVDPRIRLA